MVEMFKYPNIEKNDFVIKANINKFKENNSDELFF